MLREERKRQILDSLPPPIKCAVCGKHLYGYSNPFKRKHNPIEILGGGEGLKPYKVTHTHIKALVCSVKCKEEYLLESMLGERG